MPSSSLPPSSACITHPVSSSSWTTSVNLHDFLLTSFQTIIKSLTLSLASSTNLCFCGNPATSSCVSAILLLLGRNSSLGSTKREKWEAARHLSQAGDRKTTKQEVHCVCPTFRSSSPSSSNVLSCALNLAMRWMCCKRHLCTEALGCFRLHGDN